MAPKIVQAGNQGLETISFYEGPRPPGAMPSIYFALMNATQSGNIQKVRELLKQGSPVSPVDNLFFDVIANRAAGSKVLAYTPLQFASMAGNLEMVQLFINKCPDVMHIDMVTMGGITPLSIAAQEGHSKVVKALLSAGANVQIRNHMGNSILWVASIKGHLECVRVLIEHGGHEPGQISKALEVSVWAGHSEIALLLMQHGAAKEQPIAHFNAVEGSIYGPVTPLMRAVEKDYLDLARMLIENGADVNWESGILSYAFRKKKGAMARLLLENGVDTKEYDGSGGVLRKAIKSNCPEAVHYLILRGEDLDQKQPETAMTPRETLVGEICKSEYEAYKSVLLKTACWQCASSESPLRKCSKCCTAAYCGQECQVQHWKTGGHKQECEKLKRKSDLMDLAGLLRLPLPLKPKQEERLLRLLNDVVPLAADSFSD